MSPVQYNPINHIEHQVFHQIKFLIHPLSDNSYPQNRGNRHSHDSRIPTHHAENLKKHHMHSLLSLLADLSSQNLTQCRIIYKKNTYTLVEDVD